MAGDSEETPPRKAYISIRVALLKMKTKLFRLSSPMSRGEEALLLGMDRMDWNELGENVSGVCRAWTKRERWIKCQLASALGTALALVRPFRGPEHGPISPEQSSLDLMKNNSRIRSCGNTE